MDEFECFEEELRREVCRSTPSPSSSSSGDKKPRARDTAPVGTNPFCARTLEERDENFPSFDQALLNQSSVSCQSSSANFSISARAALYEHNRHVALYGIEDSMHQEHEHDLQSTSLDPLDAEWDRLFFNTNTINLSRISSNRSSQSTAPSLPSHKVVASHSIEEGEAIEVMTDISVSDYFNTSRVQLLRTPEHIRFAPNHSDGITTREREAQLQSDTSDASSSNESAIIMQNLCLNAGLPPQYFASTASQHTDHSFSLNNMDLSRISADGSESVRNVDFSFNNNNVSSTQSINSSNEHLFAIDEVPAVTDSSCKIKNHKQQRQQQHLPYIMGSISSSNSARRLSPRNRPSQHIFHSRGSSQQESVSPIRLKISTSASIEWGSPQRPPLTPKRSSLNETSPSSSTKRQDNLDKLELSPIFTSASQFRIGGTGADIEDDAKQLGLSPISKQAADSAISLLQSTAWKATTFPKKNQQKLTYRNPFADDTDAPNDANDTLDNVANTSSNNQCEIKNNLSCTVVEYDTTRPHDYTEDISPLHSSSEGKKNESGESSHTMPNLFDKCDLKKSSVSSISANSSSEHHVTTKQTSSSSMSRSSTRQQKPSLNSAAQSCAASLPSWAATDPRRYRTVVPWRVFMAEPKDFPNEDDSFSFPFVDRRVPSNDLLVGYDSFSAPARQQHAIPIFPRTDMRRLGERSIMSSPR